MNKEIKEYAVSYYPNGATRINLFFTDDTWTHYKNLDPPRACLLIDLLRNEKPVFWNKERDFLWTGREPVGEGEKEKKKTATPRTSPTGPTVPNKKKKD